MPVTDALLWVHGTPPATAAAFLTAGSAYSTNEIDFGAPAAGTSTPYLPEFPSLTEKGYSPSASQFGGNIEWGLHLVVGVAFDTLTSITLDAVSAATTNATTIIASRPLTLAQLAIAGAHYFVAVNTQQVLEFLRGHGTLVGSNNVAGTCSMWFGPRTGGEL